MAALSDVASDRGVEVVEAIATKSADVQSAARSLVGKVDAIYLPTDNTVISAAEAAISIATAERIPVFAGDGDTVKRGALGTVGFSYYNIGLETGQMVVDILNGQSAGAIAPRVATGNEVTVNMLAAQQAGVAIPDEVVSNATTVVK